jgi:Fibronectin type III domain/Family of unknown function (DUF5719)
MPCCVHSVAAAMRMFVRRCARVIAVRRVLSCVIVPSCAVLALPASTSAAWVTLAWDANTDPDVAGYVVHYRAERGRHWGGLNVGPATTAQVGGLRSGQRYRFWVTAYDSRGFSSDPSIELGVVAIGPDEPGASEPTETLYFAEGATGVFHYRLALLNAETNPASVIVSFLREGAAPIVRDFTIPAQARATIDASEIPELQSTSFAAMVHAPPRVLAERTMTWNTGGLETGAHTAKNLLAPSPTWYLAEGNAGFFDTFVLLANPTDAVVRADVSFLLDDGAVVPRAYDLQPHQRLTIYTNEIDDLQQRSFATTVRATAPILVERAMYFRATPSGMFTGGHASAALAEGATHWFLAEGQTGSFFDMFVLIANPQPHAVDATIRYLTQEGEARVDTLTLPPTSRTTIAVDDLPGLESSSVSCDISAAEPIVVERSMYWPGGAWYGASNVTGLSALGQEWAFAEGEIGGPEDAASYLLLVNPGTTAAQTTLTFFRENGAPPIVVSRTVGANARETIDASSVGLDAGERFGVLVSSDQPIAAERALYGSAGGVFWGSGTAEIGTRIR